MTQVLAPRAGPTGLIANLLKWGMQIIDVVSGEGAIKKYTVGPAWTGAEFTTLQAAVDQAVLDGHSGATFGNTVEFTLYPAVYADAVVIPATLPRWNLVGTNNTVGSVVSGPFTVEMPSTGAGFGISQIRFSGAFNVTQAVTSGSSLSVRLFDVAFLGASTVSVSNFVCEAVDTIWGSGVAHVWTMRNLTASAGRFLGQGTFDCGTAGGTAFQGTYIFNTVQPILTFRGRACSLDNCLVYYSGGLAVLDECTDFSEYQNNTFSRNVGATGPVIRKTGASSLSDGGNNFVDGQTYPFFEILGGSRPNRGQTDDELRNVFLMVGSPVLTPAEVGGQRKTTIAKTGGGGTVTLPLAADVELGCTVIVKDLNGNATANPFTVEGQGGDLIDGAASVPVATDYQALEFQAVGAGTWMLIGRAI